MMSKNIELVAVFIVLAIIGIFILTYQKIKSIDSFEECVQMTGEILDSFPQACQTPDGRYFTDEVPSQRPI